VHNPKVTQSFLDKGVKFVESLDEITNPDAIVTFSAHGINRAILDEASHRFQAVYNLECPLVSKIYRQIDMYLRKGITRFFYIGQHHHQE
jgi:4-hydroxy-3-methylbut-2-enyl diphosphate reductase